MGYITYFNLNYYGSPEDEKALENFVPSEKEFSFPEGIQMLISDSGDHDWKWYDWEDDMKKLARKFPRILFILDGDGELSDDLWQWRAKGNEIEYHEMVMPPFKNPNLLLENELKIN